MGESEVVSLGPECLEADAGLSQPGNWGPPW
jgi:hypothetical protein